MKATDCERKAKVAMENISGDLSLHAMGELGPNSALMSIRREWPRVLAHIHELWETRSENQHKGKPNG